jgi:hypothetical protein
MKKAIVGYYYHRIYLSMYVSFVIRGLFDITPDQSLMFLFVLLSQAFEVENIHSRVE